MAAITASLITAMAAVGTAVGASSAAAVGVGTAVTLGAAAGLTGIGGIVGGSIAKANTPSGGGGYPSASTASTSSKKMTIAQLQAGNANISNTLGDYTSNTLNTARGRLLNI